MFNFNPRERSVQGGFIGNAGAPDTTVAGTWIRDPFPQGQQPELDQLWRRGMQETERGRQMQENIEKLRQTLPQAMGMPGMNIGNVGGMSGTLNPFSGYMQAIANMQNKDKPANVTQQPEEVENSFASGTLNPFSRYMQAMTNMQQTKQAGFNQKTVS